MSDDLLERLLNAPMAFGLRQQGLLPQVEALLADGQDWNTIGRAIGWDGATARSFYERERARQVLTLEGDEQEVALPVGAWLDIVLPSAAGGGYLWEGQVSAVVDGQDVGVSAPARVLVREAEATDLNVPIGGPASERFGVCALRPCSVRLVFAQFRPFEKTTLSVIAAASVRVMVPG